ncbi:MAG: 3,8-cyclase [Chthoniobacter sp.]|jgi:cyclic pyranopterin phosphate synthase|nr:3,8-cyclase [Chthoniobacter sp.]
MSALTTSISPRANVDAASRTVDYLRISITDRCNERCLYCLPEGFTDWKKREEILGYEEILHAVRAAVGLGFRKFRVTGGEPLLRRDAELFIRDLIAEAGVERVGLSTNGTRLAALAPALAAAGLRSANISLDAIEPEIYRQITGGNLRDVLAGIEAAQAAGISELKLNCVLMRGVNESQIMPLVQFAATHGLVLRFIELMPVSLTSVLNEENFFPIHEAKKIIGAHTAMAHDGMRRGNGPAVYFSLPEFRATVGFIGALTDFHFCEACNKIRLTADGRIRPCLGDHGEIDLEPALRPELDPVLLRGLFLQALREKPAEHGFRNNYQPGRVMTAIGG